MKSSKYISILCVGSLLSLASCTDGFESDNKINGSFDDTVKEYDFQKYTTNFETIQKGIYFNKSSKVAHLNIYISGDIHQSKTIMWIKVVLASGFHRHLNRMVLSIFKELGIYMSVRTAR
jgi:hypothetical protein